MQNPIQSILQSMLSPDTKTIKDAEMSLLQQKQDNFVQTFENLVQALSLQDSNQAELASLLLQNKYINSTEDLKKCPENILLQLLQICQQLFTEDKKLLFLKRLSEIVVKVCAFLNKNESIVQFIQSLINSQNEKIILAQLYFIEIICEFSFDDEMLMQHNTTLTQIFETHLSSQNITIKVAAMKTICCFLVTISDEKFLKQFEKVFPILLETSINAIKSDQDAGRTSLNSLSELVEVHPKFVKPMFNQLLQLTTEILGLQLDSSTKGITLYIKGCALDVIVMLCTHIPQLIRKSDFFKQNTLKQMVEMVANTDISQNQQEWEEDIQEQNISKNDNSSVSLDAFSKITMELSSKFLIPCVFPFVIMAIQSQQLSHKYAGLMILSQICIECKEAFGKELNNMMAMILNIDDQKNSRVQWAVLQAMAVLCEEFSPQIQTTYNNEILSYVCLQMKNKNSVKLQFQALSCLINFCRDLIEYPEDSECIMPFSSQILQEISNLFQQGLDQKQYVLIEEVLLALSNMAEVLKEKFAQYYNNFMPGLKTLLVTLPSDNQQQINIRVLTIESIGFLMSAVQSVQNVQIKQDQILIIKTLIDIQNNPNLQKDDPHHSAIISVYSNLCVCMKENFAEYMPQIFEKIAQAAMINVDFQIGDDVEKENPKMISKTIDLKMFGGKKTIALNSHAIEQKTVGSQTLLSISQSLKKLYGPYAEQTLQIILSNITYKHSKQIRQNSLKTLVNIIQICDDENKMAIIVNNCFDVVLKELELSKQGEDILFVLQNILEIIKPFKSPLIDLNLVNKFIPLLQNILKMQENLKKSLIKSLKEDLDDIDDQQREDFEEDYEQINDLFEAVQDISSVIVRLYPQQQENNIANTLGPFYMSTFQNKQASDNEMVYALCFFDDLMDYCSENMFNQAFPQLCNNYINLQIKNMQILRAQAYGFGIFAQKCPQQQIQQYIPQIKQFLLQIIDDKDAFIEDNIETTEVAIASLGKLSLFQNQQDTFNKFLAFLPLKSEPEECQSCHLILLQQIKQQNQIIMGSIEQVKQIVDKIKQFDERNPTLEILNEESKQLIQQI